MMAFHINHDNKGVIYHVKAKFLHIHIFNVIKRGNFFILSQLNVYPKCDINKDLLHPIVFRNNDIYRLRCIEICEVFITIKKSLMFARDAPTVEQGTMLDIGMKFGTGNHLH